MVFELVGLVEPKCLCVLMVGGLESGGGEEGEGEEGGRWKRGGEAHLRENPEGGGEEAEAGGGEEAGVGEIEG